MKIVCDNCGAKYSIADEKVAGKVFKIRCKKCTHVIVVRGDQSSAADDAATSAGFDYGGDATWHVVVDGDQQGPFSPQQLGEMMTAGQIDWEAYVWKEGFDGWKPARDIPELVTAISGDEAEQGGGDAAFGADPFAGGGGFGGDAGFAAPAPQAARASADAGADLFAQSDPASSPFGAAEDDGVVASASSPRVSQEQASMTGQRNENSVLFSLSNLQALATGGPSGAPAAASSGPKPSAPAAKAGHATGEGSGLIDIRALASATAAPSSGGGSAKKSDAMPDDLLAIGGSGGLGSSLGAPVLAPAAPEPEKNNKGLIVGLSIAGFAVIGLLVALVVILSKEPEPVATVAGAAPNAAGGELANPNAATPAVPAAAGVAPAVPAVPAAATPTTPTAMAEEEAAPETESERRERGSSSRRDRPSSAMESAPARATAMEEAPAAMSTAMGGGNIDDLLDRALGGGNTMAAAMAAAPAAMASGPEQPNRDDVGRALRSVSARVESCGGGTAGVANAAITFGSSGRVSSVNVTGVPPAVQSCVARGVRSAQVQPFTRPTFNVNFPFRVR